MSTPQWPSGDEPFQHQRPEATPPPPYQPTPPAAQQTEFLPAGVTQPVRADVIQPPKASFRTVMIALGVGSLVAVALGVYAGLHTPTGFAFNLGLFSTGLAAKAWLTSVVFVLAIVQLISSMMIYGKLPGGGAVVSGLHRWSGRLAVVVSLPVAAHCLYAFGFSTFDTRNLVHSLLGCFFYGIFVCKMIVLTREDSPKWALPLFGGLVFTTLTGLWLTSSLWFFSSFGLVF